MRSYLNSSILAFCLLAMVSKVRSEESAGRRTSILPSYVGVSFDLVEDSFQCDSDQSIIALNPVLSCGTNEDYPDGCLLGQDVGITANCKYCKIRMLDFPLNNFLFSDYE